MLLSVKRTGTIQLDAGQEIMEFASVLSHCFLIRNPLSKPAGVLGLFRQREINCWFSILLGRLLLTTSLRRRRMIMYISSFTVAIPVHYSSEFLKILEGITY